MYVYYISIYNTYVNTNTYQCHNLACSNQYRKYIICCILLWAFNGGFGGMPGKNVLDLIRLIIHTYVYVYRKMTNLPFEKKATTFCSRHAKNSRKWQNFIIFIKKFA